MLREQQQLAQERTMRQMRQKQTERVAKSEQAFAAAVEQHDQEAAHFVPKVAEYLRLTVEDQRRKAATLHRAWEETVFDNISEQISTEVDRRHASGESGARWRAAQSEYLEACSRKDAGLFRDIIIESEYDPMTYTAANIKYKSKGIQDPVKLELIKPEVERKTIPGAHLAPRGPLLKDTLHPVMWSKLEATPYGRFNKMMAAAETKKSEAADRLRQSHVHFDDFERPPVDEVTSMVTSEFPKPKRTFAQRPSALFH